MTPGYLKLSQSELKKRTEQAWELLESCQVCPRKCGVNRANNQKTGFCKMGKYPKVYSAHPHFGEESCLVGTGGSGTIFFSSCNLACVYCQNWEISQERQGQEVSFQELADTMLSLQNMGCHNINFVSPTIWVVQILKSLILARDKGLTIPLVYNTGGYDSVKTLKILNGIIDIYMPDIKYSDNSIGLKYSNVKNYWKIVKEAVREMYNQVSDLKLSNQKIATRGLLIRHLILPNKKAGTEKVMKFIATVSRNTFVNILGQYHPSYNANKFPKINRQIDKSELHHAFDVAKKYDLWRFD